MGASIIKNRKCPRSIKLGLFATVTVGVVMVDVYGRVAVNDRFGSIASRIERERDTWQDREREILGDK